MSFDGGVAQTKFVLGQVSEMSALNCSTCVEINRMLDVETQTNDATTRQRTVSLRGTRSGARESRVFSVFIFPCNWDLGHPGIPPYLIDVESRPANRYTIGPEQQN